MVKVTTGQWMFYGGIALIGIGILALVLYVPLFSRQRKKLEQKIKEDY
ncbi:MAG: hypothetical protein K2P38_02740 [Lachnospiraceae bacterium]|nr:hypothetical protein [Lachnospiraceae bacterium]